MKEINIKTGEVHMNLKSGMFYVTADAMATLKEIGEAYKIFSTNYERRGFRIAIVEKKDQKMLVAQAHTGDSGWEPVSMVTKDPKQIRAWLAFQELLDAIHDMELVPERVEATSKEHRERKSVRDER